MLRPRTQLFKVKVMLHKLQAVSNKVASRCHATLRIDNEEITFKSSPQLKKNTAAFNSQVDYDNYSLQLDEITGLYENKIAVLVLEIETQGTRVKMGEAVINMGNILNDKKYRIVTSLPLNKCYDKTARVKISVDFIPITGDISDHKNTHRDIVGNKKEVMGNQKELGANQRELNSTTIQRQHTRHVVTNTSHPQKEAIGGPRDGGSNWKQSNYKSRLAQQSNYILQEKLYEYEQKMDNYRLTQAQMQEKLHEQISVKDENISELTMELSRRGQQLADMSLQNEQLRFRLKEQIDQNVNNKQTNKALSAMIEQLQRQEETLRKQNATLRSSLENLGRTRQNKEKHLTLELSKYSQKYLESEQQRNRVIFELETKFKEELQKKQQSHRLVHNKAQIKHQQSINIFSQKIKQLEVQLDQLNQLLESTRHDLKRTKDALGQREAHLQDTKRSLQITQQDKEKLNKKLAEQGHELQTLQFGYNETERELARVKQESASYHRSLQQVRMQLSLANQTIDEQRQNLTKYSKEIQVHQERQYYLSQRFNDQIEIKSIHENNMRGESNYYRQQVQRLKHKLTISNEHAEEETHKAQQLAQSVRKLQEQLSNRSRNMALLGEEKMLLENENRALRGQVSEMEEAILMLKEDNVHLGEQLLEKKNALQSDRSLQWSYKIEELQRDIAQMLEKFKMEKELLQQNYRRQQSKRKEEIAALHLQLNKLKDDSNIHRQAVNAKQLALSQQQKHSQQLKQALRKQQNEVGVSREQEKAYAADNQVLTNKLNKATALNEQKLKQIEELRQKQAKTVKKWETAKNNYVRAISYILEYLTKPHQLIVSFQEMPALEVEPELVSMINLSVRKFCQQRNRARQNYKKLEQESEEKHANSVKQVRVQEQKIGSKSIISHQVKKNYFQEQAFVTKQAPQQDDSYHADTLREENAKLKRQISEMRVKLKQNDEQVARAERQAEQERFARDAAKREMDELHEEMEKVSFQLRRKDKLLVEYESEIRDMQNELVTLKTHSNQPSRPNLSRNQIRMREKQESIYLSRREAAIKDLQNKLSQKTRQLEGLLLELNRQKAQNAVCRQNMAQMANQLKQIETKLKEKHMRCLKLQDQMGEVKERAQLQFSAQNDKHAKQVGQLQEEILSRQTDIEQLAQRTVTLEQQKVQLQKRVRAAKDETRTATMRLKREHDSAVGAQKETVSSLQTTILALKAQAQKTSIKVDQMNVRINSLTAALATKNNQLQAIGTELLTKKGELMESQQFLEEIRASHQRKNYQMVERIGELEGLLQEKDYELEECRFSNEGRLLDMQRQLEEAQAGR